MSPKAVNFVVDVDVVVVFVVVVVIVYVAFVIVGYPRNIRLRFGLNHLSSSWDIADIEIVWWVVGGWAESFSYQTKLLLC